MPGGTGTQGPRAIPAVLSCLAWLVGLSEVAVTASTSTYSFVIGEYRSEALSPPQRAHAFGEVCRSLTTKHKPYAARALAQSAAQERCAGGWRSQLRQLIAQLSTSSSPTRKA